MTRNEEMHSMSKIQLAVIFGSRSCEHEVSIISAVQLMRNVNKEKYDLIPIYISQSGIWYTGESLLDMKTYTPFDPYNRSLKRVSLDLTAGSGVLVHLEHGKGLFSALKEEVVARIDCVIPVFHGLHGEDGSVQGILEVANIPYASRYSFVIQNPYCFATAYGEYGWNGVVSL